MKIKIEGSGITTFNSKEDFFEQALRVSEQRLTVLASNIANADTPNYKARDIDFRQALALAMNSGGSSTNLQAKMHPPQADNPLATALLYRVPYQSSVDGNTVEVDAEVAAFTTQAIKHQLLLQKVQDEYKELESVFKNVAG
ncbi:flagellar basal body rod protein FlgB [Massilia sp. SR12]